MNFASYRDLSKDVLALVPFCLKHRISEVWAVPRSGFLPGAMLAAALQIPLGAVGETAHSGRRLVKWARKADGPALLVDDAVGTGASMTRWAAQAPHDKFLRACVYVTPGNEDKVDVYVRRLAAPRLFEWNVFNCDRVTETMFDMDGVFCRDPTVFDDGGAKYASALAMAEPKYTTMFPVGWICTNRLTRWRGLTEAWLARNGITVRHGIYMQSQATAEARRVSCGPGAFKAWCYVKETGCQLFVESEDEQANVIASLSGKPVLSVQSMRMFG